MDTAALLITKRFSLMALILLFGGIVLFCISDNTLFLVPSFGCLFVALIVADIRKAYWCLLFLVPLSIHTEFAGNRYSLSLPSEPLMFFFYSMTILLIVLRPGNVPLWFIKNKITLIISLQFLWLLVAVVFSQVPLLSFKFLLSKSWYLACFFILPVWILKSKQDFKIAFIVLLLPILLYTIIVFTRHAAYGFRFFYIDTAVGNLFYKHVDYASVISLFFPFVLTAWHHCLLKKQKIHFVLLLLVLFFIAAIVLSYTRAAMVGLLFGLVVVIAIRFRKVNIILPSFYVLLLAVSVYFVADNKYLNHHPDFKETYMRHEFGEHLKATIAGKDVSSVERVYRWIAAIRMSGEHPLTGFGPHSFYPSYRPYTLSSFRTYSSDNKEKSTVHNYFLLMLVEQGIPAMILYTLLTIIVLSQAQATYYRFEDPFYKTVTLATAMAFAIFFVNNFFSELLETDKVGPLVYLLLAVLVILDHKSRAVTTAVEGNTGRSHPDRLFA